MNTPKTLTKVFSGILSATFIFLPLAFAHAAGTATIQTISPGQTVNAGSGIDFDVATTGFTNPTFTVTDSFSGSSIVSSDINEHSGYFYWVPITSDAGSHVLTVTVLDTLGDSAIVTEPITVHSANSPSLSIEFLTPGSTIPAGQTVSFFPLPINFSLPPTYTLTDSFSGSSITSSDISAAGKFSWTPTSNDVGTHVITITAQNSEGNTATAQETLTVTSSGTTTVSTPVPTITTTPIVTEPTGSSASMVLGTDVVVGNPVSLTVSAPNLAGPTYTLNDSFPGSTISNADILSTGQFTWIPNASDVGTHSITVNGSDSSGHTASLNFQVLVMTSATAAATPAVSTTDTTALPSSFTFSGSLALGDQSSEVTDLQNYLTQQGLYSGPVTGYYGALTQTAVESFQKAHGISAIGTVGPLTIAALNQNTASSAASTGTSVITVPPTVPTSDTTTSPATSDTSTSTSYTFSNQLSLGSTGADVTALQQKLTSLNMYSGPVTGYYGTLTQTAVEKFQTANNISPLGNVGPATLAALNQ
jgi:peptidoglycan hydrolase-like protein with peptidoglycan-binding domain